MPVPVLSRASLGWLVLAVLALAGCEPAPSQPSATTQPVAERIAEKSPPAAEPFVPLAEPRDGGRLLEEEWYALSIAGSRVGYTHATIAEVEEGKQKLLRLRGATRMVMRREGQPTTQDILLTSWETPAGQVLRCESRMTAGPAELVATGTVTGDKLELVTGSLGKTQRQSLPWQADFGGFFADQQALRRAPLKPGEKRTIKALQPVLNVVAEMRFTAGDYETVRLPVGERKLLRVDCQLQLGNQPLETIYWIDEQGHARKSLVPQIGQEIVQTTAADALQPGIGTGYDLMIASTVKLRGELPNPPATKRVVYEARVSQGKIAGIFPECLAQRVKPIDEQTAEVTVLAIRPDDPAKADIPPAPPAADDLAPNNLIQSDDPLIVKMAQEGAAAGSDWEVAQALERFVSRTITSKNYSQVFATASEVARAKEGDCTEHAVLLAALLRARKIPARAALGLVYYPKQRGFAYHMWNEAWIDGRWVPLDATLGRGGIGADHLKLADTSLQGASAYGAMLPVIQVFGRLELSVQSVE
ncbi:MAG: transglutaminase family protein [Pirellulaceae bacterium]|nr:transglutaminase family protein [Pirellulaceae bacterium]